MNHNFSLAALDIYFRKRRKKNFVKLVCTILFVIISCQKRKKEKKNMIYSLHISMFWYQDHSSYVHFGFRLYIFSFLSLGQKEMVSESLASLHSSAHCFLELSLISSLSLTGKKPILCVSSIYIFSNIYRRDTEKMNLWGGGLLELYIETGESHSLGNNMMGSPFWGRAKGPYCMPFSAPTIDHLQMTHINNVSISISILRN